MNHDTGWLPTYSVFQSGKIPMYCFPYAGGGASLFHQWQPLVSDVCEIVPVRLPGREGRIREPAMDNMQRLVDTLIKRLAECWTSSFALFGHSMGALIAFELARRTIDAGRGPQILFLSSCRPPNRLRRDDQDPLHEMPDGEMIDQLLERYGMRDSVSVEEKALMQMLALTLRADLKLVHNYRCEMSPRLSCPVIVCGGADDPQVTRADLQGWQQYSSSTITVRVFPGGHFYLRNQKDAVTKLIRDRVSQWSEP